MPNTIAAPWILAGVLGALLAFLLLARLRAALREKERYRKTYETENFSPADTFCGTLKHLGGLPAPLGLSLGVAANPAFGIVFARNRFRYVVEKKDVESVEICSRAEGFEAPGPLPRPFVVIRLKDGRRLTFSMRRLSRFGKRLKLAMRLSLPSD